MLACMLLLPESIRKVLSDISLPVLLVYPPATMLYGRLIVELEARNEAPDELKESQQLYEALAESSTVGIGCRDEVGRFFCLCQQDDGNDAGSTGTQSIARSTLSGFRSPGRPRREPTPD